MRFMVGLDDYRGPLADMAVCAPGRGGDALDVFPELRRLEKSAPMTYEVGDITVHTHLTVHGAGPNLLDRPRWAYILITQPGDVCWNGSPCPNFDWTAMKPWEPFGDDRFPVIS